jgi:phospholipid/cholesterol/gamma-HCH transport system substrate-binding protein
MSKKALNTAKLGFFVIAGIMLFTLATYLIGNQENMFRPMLRVSAIFHDASGLKVGNNVRYAGISVGSVEKITFINDTTIQVFMKMDRKLTDFVKKDAIATIEMEGLVGSMVINISPGTSEADLVEEGDIILSDSRPDVLNMLKTLNETNENLKGLTSNLLEITNNLEQGTGTIPRLLRDENMGADMAAGFRNVRKATEDIGLAVKKLNQEIDQIQSGKGTLGFLLHDEQLPDQLLSLGSDLDSLVNQRLEPLFDEMDKALADVNVTTGELKQAAQDINSSEGLVRYLLADTNSVNDIKVSMKNIQEGTIKFNETMDALKASFLFRGHFKKQEEESRK